MYKKLEEETIDDILEAGIDEFIEKGLQGAAMSGIAKKSGVSVGVIYKYFTDKNTFFLQCLDHSLELLSNVLQEAVSEAKDLRGCIRKIVAALISNTLKIWWAGSRADRLRSIELSSSRRRRKE